MSKNAIPPTRYGEIASFLGGISQYTYNQFLNLLLYLHFTLTGEKLELERAFSLTNTEYQAVIGQRHSQSFYEAREEGVNPKWGTRQAEHIPFGGRQHGQHPGGEAGGNTAPAG